MKAAQRSERQTRGPIRLCQSSPAHSLTLTFSEGATGQPAPAALEHSTYSKEIHTSSQTFFFFPLLFSIHLDIYMCVCVYGFTVGFPSYSTQPPIDSSLFFLDHIIFYHSTIPYFSTHSSSSQRVKVSKARLDGWMGRTTLTSKEGGNRPRRSPG